VVRIKTKDIEDHTTKDYNTKVTIEVIIKTRPKRNIIFIIRKDISLQNIIPKTIKLLTNNIIDNLYI
jgi:hypothetical protein